jgi:predicted Zn-dependent protease with MMP-like domain
MKHEVYERLVQETLDSLPDDLRSRMHNVAIVIEDRPTRQQLRDAGIRPPGTLFGLYQGIPLKDRGGWYGNVLPDKITIFRKPIEAYSPTWDELARRVRQTVLHEIGHHFGLSEGQLREIELGWRQ